MLLRTIVLKLFLSWVHSLLIQVSEKHFLVPEVCIQKRGGGRRERGWHILTWHMLNIFHLTVSYCSCHHLAFVDTRCSTIFCLSNSFLSSVDFSYVFWNLTLSTHTWLRAGGRLLTLAAFDEHPSTKQKLFCFWPLERVVTQGNKKRPGLEQLSKTNPMEHRRAYLRHGWNYSLARDWKKFPYVFPFPWPM